MRNAEDAAIVRQIVRVVAAAIFCLLCGGVSGLFVIRGDDPPGLDNQQVKSLAAAPDGSES